MPDLDRTPRLAAAASRQYGVVAVWQLYEIGFNREAVRAMVEAGRLHRLHRGVYAVGHRSLSPRGKLLAAVYGCGKDAVASHHAAAWMWEVRRGSGGVWHVTIPRRTRGPTGVRVHCVRALHEEDVAVIDGIPVTSLARTLVDEGALLSMTQLRRTFEEADRRGLLDASAITRVCERGRGRKGVANARVALSDYEPDSPKLRSEGEEDLRDFCRANGIPQPGFNLWVAGQEVDAAWLDAAGRVLAVAEFDSWEYHRTRAAFERDRERAAALAAARIPHIPITSRRIERDGTALRAQLLSLLAVSG